MQIISPFNLCIPSSGNAQHCLHFLATCTSVEVVMHIICFYGVLLISGCSLHMENSHALFDTGKELLLGQCDQGCKMVLGHRSELMEVRITAIEILQAYLCLLILS